MFYFLAFILGAIITLLVLFIMAKISLKKKEKINKDKL